MGLAQPLGLLLGGTIAVLVLLYLRQRHRQSEAVPSLYLWRSLVDDPPRARRFQPDILFLLQLLALLALTLGVARPYLIEPTARPAARHTILVIDTTASTQAIDVAPSRFDAARGLARARVDAMSPDDQAVIIAAGARPELKQSFTSDRDRLQLTLSDLDPTDVGGDLRPALSLAREIKTDLEDARIVVFTDRNGAPHVDGDDIETHVVGRSDDNVAISALDVVQGPFDKFDRARIVVQVQSYAHNDKHALLGVTVDGTSVLEQGFSLGPRESRSFIVDHAPSAGVVRAELRAGDALPRDDVAFGWIRRGPTATIVLVGQESPLADALRSLTERLGLMFVRVDTDAAATSVAPRPRVLIFNATMPASLPSENSLFLRPPRRNTVFPVIDEIQDAEIIDWNAQHPIFAQLQPLPALPLQRAQLLDVPNWAAPLLWSHSGTTTHPIAAAGVFEGHRYACLGFDPSAEGLLANDRVDRLLTFTNVLAWLAPQGDRAVVTRAGHAAAVPAALAEHACDDTAHLCTRDGVVEPSRVGVAELRRGDDTISVLTNFGGIAESDIQSDAIVEPRSTLAPESRPSTAAARRGIGPWLFFAALALLVIEWWARGRQPT